MNEHKKFFETGKTKNIEFRIQQLVKLKQVLKANEELIIEAMHQDLGKSRFEAFTTEIGVVYVSIGLLDQELKKMGKTESGKNALDFFRSKKLCIFRTIRYGFNYRSIQLSPEPGD